MVGDFSVSDLYHRTWIVKRLFEAGSETLIFLEQNCWKSFFKGFNK